MTSELCAQELRKISGVVLDSITGQAISDVHISTSSRGTISNEHGRFCISLDKDEVVFFTHVNYHPVRLQTSDSKEEDLLTIALRQRVKILPEVRVSATPSEKELKSKILEACVPATRAEEDLKMNSKTINTLGRIAPPPVPTLSEQYFESLQGPKDATLLSSNPRRGLLAIIRNQNQKPKQPARPSDYRSDPAIINPFVIKIHPVDTLERDSTIVTRQFED
jgi:hypothetical protein